VLREDARDLALARRDEARAAGRVGHRRKARPADAAAPQRRDAPVLNHGRAVARALEIDRLEVAVAIHAERIDDVAAQQHQARAFRAPRHGLAAQVLDRAIGTVGAHHEHAGRGVHRPEDPDVRGRRPVHPRERLVRGLTLHQREVELAGLEQRHVLGAALGVARLDRDRGIGLVHALDERGAVDRKAAARRGGAEREIERLVAHGESGPRLHGDDGAGGGNRGENRKPAIRP
jgi:hypothetical protein